MENHRDPISWPLRFLCAAVCGAIGFFLGIVLGFVQASSVALAGQGEAMGAVIAVFTILGAIVGAAVGFFFVAWMIATQQRDPDVRTEPPPTASSLPAPSGVPVYVDYLLYLIVVCLVLSFFISR